MPTLTQGQIGTETVDRGRRLTLTVNSGSAIVERAHNGRPLDTTTLPAGAVTVFGEYHTDIALRISCVTGSCTYAKSQSTDPVVAAVSGVVNVGTFTTVAALQAAYPAATNAGKTALVGSGPSYYVAGSNGVLWAASAGVKAVGASRDLTAEDAGLTLDCTAGAITLNVPDGLPVGFGCAVQANGTTSVSRSGTALLNGAGTTVTRLDTANRMFAIVQRSVAGSYVVTGS